MGGYGEEGFLFLQSVNAVLDGAGADELVDKDIFDPSETIDELCSPGSCLTEEGLPAGVNVLFGGFFSTDFGPP